VEPQELNGSGQVHQIALVGDTHFIALFIALFIAFMAAAFMGAFMALAFMAFAFMTTFDGFLLFIARRRFMAFIGAILQIAEEERAEVVPEDAKGTAEVEMEEDEEKAEEAAEAAEKSDDEDASDGDQDHEKEAKKIHLQCVLHVRATADPGV